MVSRRAAFGGNTSLIATFSSLKLNTIVQITPNSEQFICVNEFDNEAH